MSKQHARVIGTTPEAIERAERALGRVFPRSFRAWILKNNGLYGVHHVKIFPVLDDRDPRKTWDSIVRQYQEVWLDWGSIHADDSGQVLPFADFGSGDYYCFDYGQVDPTGEAAVVIWSHETGETEFRAGSFSEFIAALEAGRIRD